MSISLTFNLFGILKIYQFRILIIYAKSLPIHLVNVRIFLLVIKIEKHYRHLGQGDTYDIIQVIYLSMANLVEYIEDKEEYNLISQDFLSGSTNKLFYETEVSSSFNYYIPGYLRLIFNSIENLDFKNLKAEVHGNLYFTLNVKDFPDSVANHVRNNIRFLFSNDPEILVKEGQEHEDGDDEEEQPEIYFEEEKEKAGGKLINHYFHYQVRKKFKATMLPKLFFTPFETIDLILFVAAKINPMNCDQIKEKITGQNFPKQFVDRMKSNKDNEKHEDEKSNMKASKNKKMGKKKVSCLKFNINLMDHSSNCSSQNSRPHQSGDFQEHSTIDYGIIRDFGNYSVADKQLMAEYSNQSVSKDIIEMSKIINQATNNQNPDEANLNRMSHFQFAHFHIKIYRNPSSATCTIFIPVLLLTIINIGIFFQVNGLSGRIQNIAGLMFAYTAIIMVIRGQIPIYHTITLMEMIVYALTGTTLLCLLEGIIFQRRDGFQVKISNPLLVITIVVSVVATVIVISLLIWHRYFRLPQLTRDNNDEPNIEEREGSYARGRYDPRGWSNNECDKHFMRFFDNGKVRPAKSLNKTD